MSRQHGTKAAIFLDDSSNACQNISGDITSMTFNGLKNRPDTTSMGVDDIRRELDGVRDATFDMSILYSDGAGACPAEMLQRMHAGTTHKRIQYFPEWRTSSSAYLTASAFLSTYNINTPVDGISTMNATFELASNRVLTPDVYAAKILTTSKANLIGYWPLWEPSGTTIDNYEGTAARDGTASGVGLGKTGIGDGRTSASFDGADDYIDIYSTSLASVFDGAEMTISIWAKVSAVGDWTSGDAGRIIRLVVDANNTVEIFMSANNTITWYYNAGGTTDTVAEASISDVGWVHYAMTVSKTGELLVAYRNGVAKGSSANLGTWTGSLDTTDCNIGSVDQLSNEWTGAIAHTAIWKTPLTAAQILNLASV